MEVFDEVERYIKMCVYWHLTLNFEQANILVTESLIKTFQALFMDALSTSIVVFFVLYSNKYVTAVTPLRKHTIDKVRNILAFSISIPLF